MRLPSETDGPAAPDPSRELVQRFTDRWDLALRGGARPSVEDFLHELSEADRAELRPLLERVDLEYVRRDTKGPAADATVEFPGPTKGASDTHLDVEPTLDSSAATIDPPGGPGVGSAPATGYQILGELGRGGMGVVYKARQVGLNRVVALKMVLSGAHASPQQLDRFRTEAEAVARLHHPNIVQIYEVGERDGLPYFSLEYLDGGSLADQIRGEPQPPDRAARTAAQLARGVQYAHSHGIAHRDLKPANILLDSDGVPKITDFGLAKKLEAGAASQTQSGTVVGTPSYMAPEQARGDVHDVGPAADVYSLGALLYELLTGRPPFKGSTLLETLEQVRTQEPVPPRQLVPKVPRDLETIALKCLQKEPAKRYPSARDLADDLERFRAGQPILARPVGAAERMVRWCKRNPRIAGLAGAVVVSLVAGTVVSTVLAVGMHRERNEKEAERQRAEEARQAAVLAEAEARKNAEDVLKQGKLALSAFGTLINQVQKEIGDSPNTQDLKLRLLETAQKGLDQVAKSDEDSRLLGQSMAAVYLQLGHLFRHMGQGDKALAQYEASYKIAQVLADRDPDGPVAQANLAATLIMLGEMSLEHGRDIQASLAYYQRALALQQAIVEQAILPRRSDPKLDMAKLRQALAESHTRVGVTYLRLGEPDRAAGYFQDALAIRKDLAAGNEKDLQLQLSVAKSHNALGEVRFRARDWPAAKEHFATALAICERLREAEPTAPLYKFELANTLGNAGVFALRTGAPDQARKHLPRGRELMAELVAADSRNALYQRYLALADYRCGTLARRSGDRETADGWDADCLRIREDLVAADPDSERRRLELLLAQARAGVPELVGEGAAEMAQKPNVDREVLVELAQCYAQMAAGPGDAASKPRYVDRALELIRQAVAQGYKDAVILETEPDLDAVRGTPGFKAVLSGTVAARPQPGK